MKKTFIIVSVVVLAALLAATFIFGRAYYIALFGDQYTEFAKRAHPLGRGHTYIISPNVETISGHDGSIIPAHTYYTFYPVKEAEQNPVDRQRIWGRYVSDKTAIDLTPYLNQPVHIWGEFEHGSIKFIQEATNAGLLLGDEVLIIEKIEIVP
jgi:hypothetical protein